MGWYESYTDCSRIFLGLCRLLDRFVWVVWTVDGQINQYVRWRQEEESHRQPVQGRRRSLSWRQKPFFFASLHAVGRSLPLVSETRTTVSGRRQYGIFLFGIHLPLKSLKASRVCTDRRAKDANHKGRSTTHSERERLVRYHTIPPINF